MDKPHHKGTFQGRGAAMLSKASGRSDETRWESVLVLTWKPLCEGCLLGWSCLPYSRFMSLAREWEGQREGSGKDKEKGVHVAFLRVWLREGAWVELTSSSLLLCVGIDCDPWLLASQRNWS